MIMETLSCGYPVSPSGLGSAPISTPSTPIGSEGPYAPQLYSQTQYVQPAYSSSPIHKSFSKYEDDANNNNPLYNTNRNITHKLSNSSDDSMLSDFGSLSLSESEERFGDLSPVSETSGFMSDMSQSPPSTITNASSRPKQKKTSRSKAKSSIQSQDGDEKKGRKDSFVYDVRLPDEQFLFFVPDLDLVKSHLMFAVREEVDVLKERIVELMDRIKHLECENTILRQYASPEVLQQIQTQMPHPTMPSHHSSTS